MIGLGAGAGAAAYQASTKQVAPAATMASAAGGSSTPTGAVSSGAGQSNQQESGRAITGSVQKIGEKEFTVTTDANSTPLTVRINDKTTFSKQVTGAISDLKQGEMISVRGEAGADGSITTASVQLLSDAVAGLGAPQGLQGAARTLGQAGGQQSQQQGTQSRRPESRTGGAGVAFGTIESVADNVVTVSRPGQSEPVKVTISDKTTITKTAAGEFKDLSEGSNVLVMGQRGADGVVVASSVQILPADAAMPIIRRQ